MYTREQLYKYPYFKQNLENCRISDVLDPLTGAVSRRYMIGFVKALIEAKIPFTFGMVDLDNFKYINDTYGHQVGDGVLEHLVNDLTEFLGDKGVVGRFGGDEFLFVNFVDLDYTEKKSFCLEMYPGGRVLRKSVKVEDVELFVTGTTGLSTFPEDAPDYDSLFEEIDKTLYRGKTKGRNCYIIYVPEKHANIVIKELKKHTLFEVFRGMAVEFDAVFPVIEKLKRIFRVFADDLNLTDMFYVGPDGQMKSLVRGTSLGSAEDIGNCVKEDIFASNSIEEIRSKSPIFSETLESYGCETTLVCVVRTGPEIDGYILFAEPRSLRIWQDDEKAIMFSLARMLAGFMRATHLKLN